MLPISQSKPVQDHVDVGMPMPDSDIDLGSGGHANTANTSQEYYGDAGTMSVAQEQGIQGHNQQRAMPYASPFEPPPTTPAPASAGLRSNSLRHSSSVDLDISQSPIPQPTFFTPQPNPNVQAQSGPPKSDYSNYHHQQQPALQRKLSSSSLSSTTSGGGGLFSPRAEDYSASTTGSLSHANANTNAGSVSVRRSLSTEPYDRDRDRAISNSNVGAGAGVVAGGGTNIAMMDMNVTQRMPVRASESDMDGDSHAHDQGAMTDDELERDHRRREEGEGLISVDLNTLPISNAQQERLWQSKLHVLQDQLSHASRERDTAILQVNQLNERLSDVKNSSYQERVKHVEKIRELSSVLLSMKEKAEPSYVLSRFFLFRILGFVYFIAFWSLLSDLHGILGSRGILPVRSFLHKIKLEGLGPAQWPTLLWLCGDGTCDMDRYMAVLLWVGIIVSLLIMCGVSIGPLFTVVWLLYLSFFKAHDSFIASQFDMLLLEAGFLAILFAPILHFKRFQKDALPSAIVLLMYRWLLFRVVFSSGLNKLNPSWTDFTFSSTVSDASVNSNNALQLVFEGQPLPNPCSWYLHQSPLWLSQLMTLCVFVCELIAPLGIWGPRDIRLGSGILIVFLELGSLVSGNWGFKNMLVIGLCFSLFDDSSIRSRLPKKVISFFNIGFGRGQLIPAMLKDGYSPLASDGTASASTTVAASRRTKNKNKTKTMKMYSAVKATLFIAICILIVVASIVPMFAALSTPTLEKRSSLSATAIRAHEITQPYALVGSYGMEGAGVGGRFEIVIEGSMDAEKWRAYEFKYKPGDVKRAPSFLAPFHQRLDWQMWYASRDNYQNHPWFVSLIVRLLDGSPEVLDLFSNNPYPNRPPKFIKATKFEYKFTDTYGGSNGWWRRRRVPDHYEYLPPVDLNNPTLIAFMNHYKWHIHAELERNQLATRGSTFGGGDGAIGADTDSLNLVESVEAGVSGDAAKAKAKTAVEMSEVEGGGDGDGVSGKSDVNVHVNVNTDAEADAVSGDGQGVGDATRDVHKHTNVVEKEQEKVKVKEKDEDITVTEKDGEGEGAAKNENNAEWRPRVGGITIGSDTDVVVHEYDKEKKKGGGHGNNNDIDQELKDWIVKEGGDGDGEGEGDFSRRRRKKSKSKSRKSKSRSKKDKKKRKPVSDVFAGSLHDW